MTWMPVLVSSAITCSDCANSSHCAGGVSACRSARREGAVAAHPVCHYQDDGVVEDVQKGEWLRLEHAQHCVKQLVVLRVGGAGGASAGSAGTRLRGYCAAAAHAPWRCSTRS